MPTEPETDRYFELIRADGTVERVPLLPAPTPPKEETPEDIDALFAGFADPESSR
jgi:hypothetical protein